MNVGGLRLGSLSERERAELLRQSHDAPISYDHVGSTLDPLRWDRPAVHAHHVEVGRGESAFAAARAALQTWVPQRGLGAEVMPEQQPVVLGATVLVVLR
ncbi:MAG: hypothetical protein QOD72_2921, partial [Acidimicrobiaceae bacterium]|nr:hypothetical protein [Acidimicrobiaceae bacterium]